MNVAVTRARRHVAVVGDWRTVSGDPFLRRLLDHVRRRGLAATANLVGDLHHPLEG